MDWRLSLRTITFDIYVCNRQCRLISSVTKRSNVIVTRHKGCCVQQLSYLLIYSHFSTTRHHRRRHWLVWISSMSWKIFTSIIVLNFQKCLWVISIIDRHWSWPWKKSMQFVPRLVNIVPIVILIFTIIHYSQWFNAIHDLLDS